MARSFARLWAQSNTSSRSCINWLRLGFQGIKGTTQDQCFQGAAVNGVEINAIAQIR
jgi:hypothetical protein